MIENAYPLVQDLLKLQIKNQKQAEIIYDQLKNHLKPLFRRLSLQSHSEYILLCQRLHLLELQPFSVISEKENENIYMFLEGKLVLDSSDFEDLDEFESSSKYVKKNKLYYQRQLNQGYIAEKQYIIKIFSLEKTQLLYVTKQSQSLLYLKHEQFLRQKRQFFMNLFQPSSQLDKQKINLFSDSLLMSQYEPNENIITIYQTIESMFIVFSGQIDLYTKRNLLCSCQMYSMFNEDCNMAFYTARVKQQANVFEITNQQLQQLPDQALLSIDEQFKMKSNLRKSLIDHHIIDLQVPEIMKTVKYEKLTPKMRRNQPSLTQIVTSRPTVKKLHTDTCIFNNNTNLTYQNNVINQDPDVVVMPLTYHRKMPSRSKLNKFFN